VRQRHTPEPCDDGTGCTSPHSRATHPLLLAQARGTQFRVIGLLRAGANWAVVGRAPETLWQAGRLPPWTHRKLL
jgi:hypothetical protein